VWQALTKVNLALQILGGDEKSPGMVGSRRWNRWPTEKLAQGYQRGERQNTGGLRNIRGKLRGGKVKAKGQSYPSSAHVLALNEKVALLGRQRVGGEKADRKWRRSQEAFWGSDGKIDLERCRKRKKRLMGEDFAK